MEKKFLKPVPLEKKKRILEKLNEGVMFEKFLHTKYIGQKRFSLEGGETTIAALDAIINTAADNRRAGSRDRHGAPRPPEYSGQYHGQNL